MSEPDTPAAGGNNIAELRALLFQSIRDVRSGTLSVDAARHVNDLAKTLVETARVEVSFLEVTGQEKGTGFLQAPATAGEPQGTPTVGNGRIVHRLR